MKESRRTMRIDRTFLFMTATLLLLIALNPGSARTASNDWEEKLRSIPQAERIKEYMRRLSAEPHHIGSPEGKKHAEWMRDQFRAW